MSDESYYDPDMYETVRWAGDPDELYDRWADKADEQRKRAKEDALDSLADNEDDEQEYYALRAEAARLRTDDEKGE
jgi:hypothetical protein